MPETENACDGQLNRGKNQLHDSDSNIPKITLRTPSFPISDPDHTPHLNEDPKNPNRVKALKDWVFGEPEHLRPSNDKSPATMEDARRASEADTQRAHRDSLRPADAIAPPSERLCRCSRSSSNSSPEKSQERKQRAERTLKKGR